MHVVTTMIAKAIVTASLAYAAYKVAVCPCTPLGACHATEINFSIALAQLVLIAGHFM